MGFFNRQLRNSATNKSTHEKEYNTIRKGGVSSTNVWCWTPCKLNEYVYVYICTHKVPHICSTMCNSFQSKQPVYFWAANLQTRVRRGCCFFSARRAGHPGLKSYYWINKARLGISNCNSNVIGGIVLTERGPPKGPQFRKNKTNTYYVRGSRIAHARNSSFKK